MKSEADSSLYQAPPKPGLGSYFKSQPQIQLWCFHPNLGQRPHSRPDGEIRPGREVKMKTNMSTCNEYLDSAQHVDLHLHHRSYVSPRYLKGVLSSPTAELIQPPGWWVWADTQFFLCCYGLDFALQLIDFWRMVDFITTLEFLEGKRTPGKVLHSWDICTHEKWKQKSFGYASIWTISDWRWYQHLLVLSRPRQEPQELLSASSAQAELTREVICGQIFLWVLFPDHIHKAYIKTWRMVLDLCGSQQIPRTSYVFCIYYDPSEKMGINWEV